METCVIRFYQDILDGQGGKTRSVIEEKEYNYKKHITRSIIKNGTLGWNYSSESVIWIMEKDDQLKLADINLISLHINSEKMKIREKGEIAGSPVFVLEG